MKKIIIPFMLAFTSSMANAEYLIKVPLEQAQRGPLPNNSIVFFGLTELVPETPVNGGSTETPVKHEPVDCLTNPTDNPQLCEERLTAWEQFVIDKNLVNDYNWNHIDWKNKVLGYIPNEPYPSTKADYLNLTNTKITNVDGLISLTSVGNLDLSDNPLENFYGLSNLKTAGYIGIVRNSQLTNVDFLSNLTSVSDLNLQKNQLTNVNGLSKLTSVKTLLYLSDNQLTNVDGLINLKIVDTISLKNNPLENVNGLANLTVRVWITIDATYSGDKLPANTIFCTKNPAERFPSGSARKSQLCESR